MADLQQLHLNSTLVLGGSSGVATLFGLPALRQLRQLGLACALLPKEFREVLPVEAFTQYSVLTSSNQLSFLNLTDCLLPPVGAWSVLFNRQLPALRFLNINSADTALVTTDDLTFISRRCPGLESLCVVPPG